MRIAVGHEEEFGVARRHAEVWISDVPCYSGWRGDVLRVNVWWDRERSKDMLQCEHFARSFTLCQGCGHGDEGLCTASCSDDVVYTAP